MSYTDAMRARRAAVSQRGLGSISLFQQLAMVEEQQAVRRLAEEIQGEGALQQGRGWGPVWCSACWDVPACSSSSRKRVALVQAPRRCATAVAQGVAMGMPCWQQGITLVVLQ